MYQIGDLSASDENTMIAFRLAVAATAVAVTSEDGDCCGDCCSFFESCGDCGDD